jgi:uncharacterized tellurite resistance protein B-like protein
MAIADLKSVLSIFSGSSPSEEEQAALYGEVLLMVLARASSSDANINPVEIETIRQIIQDRTGQEVTDVDVRKAARRELYDESHNLRKYLRGVQGQLKAEDKVSIANALADVIKSDTSISVLEIDFFNRVAGALELTPAELVGLAA